MLHELAAKLRTTPLPVALPALEASLIAVAQHLDDIELPRAIPSVEEAHLQIRRLAEAKTSEALCDGFLAIADDLLAPACFRDRLSHACEELEAYLAAIAFRRLNDPSRVAGTISAVVIKVIQDADKAASWDQWNEDEWKYALARRVDNEANARAKKRHRRNNRRTRTDDLDAIVASDETSGAAPDRASLSQEDAVHCSELLGHLSEQEGEICDLRLQGYTNEEIAEALDIPLRTLERALSHIREGFRLRNRW